MGPSRPTLQRRPCGRQPGEAAVTPVIGAVLILGITILGIGGVLFWGGPMIDRIQAQNAQSAVVGEFEEIRDSSRELSVPDHSRFPTIVIPRGELFLQQGSRLLVTEDRDSANKNCDFRVKDWADTGANKGTVTIALGNCRTSGTPILTISSVSGATLVSKYSAAAAAGTVTPSPAVDFSTGDWLFRLTNAAAGATECPATICAEAWLHSTDQVSWTMTGASGKRTVSFDNGAIFSDTDGTLFLEREPSIGDSAFGGGYYGLWMRSLTAASYGSFSGAGSHQVYLSLLGNYDRADTGAGCAGVATCGVYRLRFDSAGTLAQGWCNALLARNTATLVGHYDSDAAACGALTGGDAVGVRSVCFTKLTSASCTGSPTTAFPFRFLHARIYTTLAL